MQGVKKIWLNELIWKRIFDVVKQTLEIYNFSFLKYKIMKQVVHTTALIRKYSKKKHTNLYDIYL